MLNRLIDLLDRGFYGIILAKNHRDWRTVIYGSETYPHLKKPKPSKHDCVFPQITKIVKFNPFVVKYPNYNMIMLSTYYGLMVHASKKEEYQM